MLSITPCQRMVSDRFPVASFVVHVPADRLFEIACATDPSLFRQDQKQRRNPSNFYTSRGGGLLRAPAGQATFLLPPDQLKRFAGHTRLYYTLGSYTGVRNESPAFTVPPEHFTHAPSIQISPDFSGKSIDRARLGRKAAVEARYGGAGAALTWGADLVGLAPPPRQPARAEEYDDGYDRSFWAKEARWKGRAAEDPSDPADPADPRDAGESEPAGYEDAPALASARGDGGYGSRQRPRASAPPPRYGGTPAPAPRPAPAPAPKRAPAPPALPKRRGAQAAAYGSRRRSTAAAASATMAEPEGAEHASDLRAPAPAPRFAGRYGAAAAPARKVRAAAADAAAPAAAPAPEPLPGGKDPDYLEEGDDDIELPAEAPSPTRALEASGVPFTIPEKFQIVAQIAPLEAGPDLYSAINADGEYNDPRHPAYQRMHLGLSWGIVQFTQRGGMLGRVLQACHRRAASRFADIFGRASDELLRVTGVPGEEARLVAVGGAFLWQEPWLTRFRKAGDVAEFRAAQNEVAIEGYLDRNIAFFGWLGFDTDRALAMAYDRLVNMGNAGGRRFLVDSVSPLRSQADRDAALAAINQRDLLSFQRSVPGLPATGRWGATTHAALIGALRGLGDKSPVKVPTLADSLDALIAASRGRRFEQRMLGLRTSTALRDTTYQLV